MPIRHVGLNNAKKVVILSNKIPGEEHMCLLLYVDKLPPLYLEYVMKTLNSAAGQAAKNLIDALFETKLPDDRNLLVTLHKEGHIKKGQADQTFVVMDALNKIKLNELNVMVEKIEEGGEAAKKLRELDEARGMNRKKRVDPLPTLTPEEVAQKQADIEWAKKKAEDTAKLANPMEEADILGHEIGEAADLYNNSDEKRDAILELQKNSRQLLDAAEELISKANEISDKAGRLLAEEDSKE